LSEVEKPALRLAGAPELKHLALSIDVARFVAQALCSLVRHDPLRLGSIRALRAQGIEATSRIGIVEVWRGDVRLSMLDLGTVHLKDLCLRPFKSLRSRPAIRSEARHLARAIREPTKR
jgi:hypothetical protein